MTLEEYRDRINRAAARGGIKVDGECDHALTLTGRDLGALYRILFEESAPLVQRRSGITVAVQLAGQEAARTDRTLGAEHLIVALLKAPGRAQDILLKLGINLRAVRDEIERVCAAEPDAPHVAESPFGRVPGRNQPVFQSPPEPEVDAPHIVEPPPAS